MIIYTSVPQSHAMVINCVCFVYVKQVGNGGHRLPPGCEALDITVTITFKGVFSARGYDDGT